MTERTREQEVRYFLEDLAELMAAEARCTACAMERKSVEGTVRPGVCPAHRMLRQEVAGFR